MTESRTGPLLSNLRLLIWTRAEFNKEALESYLEFHDRNLKSALLCLAGKRDAWWRDVWQLDAVLDALDRILGLRRPDHSFSAPAIDWASPLTEPQATRTIAKLLDAGRNPLRAQRIAASLRALGVKDAPEEELLGCEVKAEADRIDLKFEWITKDNIRRIVIIEAKFGHQISKGRQGKKGQLRTYRESIKEKYKVKPEHCIILAPDRSKMNGLSGQQNGIWRFVSWRSFWLHFERDRPEENDINMMIFLNTLWHRICA